MAETTSKRGAKSGPGGAVASPGKKPCPEAAVVVVVADGEPGVQPPPPPKRGPSALLVTPTGEIKLVHLPKSGKGRLKAMQRWVGGNIEAMPRTVELPDDHQVRVLQCYVNEEGKLNPVLRVKNNLKAEILLLHAGFYVGEYVAGNALFVVENMATGGMHSLRKRDFEALGLEDRGGVYRILGRV